MNKTLEQERLQNTSPLRPDLKLSVNIVLVIEPIWLTIVVACRLNKRISLVISFAPVLVCLEQTGVEFCPSLLVFEVGRTPRTLTFGFHSFDIDHTTELNKPLSSNPVVTIKLNEQEEIIADPNTGQPQHYFAETFFQMNTSTGEWKRIKKLRPVNQVNWKRKRKSEKQNFLSVIVCFFFSCRFVWCSFVDWYFTRVRLLSRFLFARLYIEIYVHRYRWRKSDVYNSLFFF